MMQTSNPHVPQNLRIAFIGGGNMANAMIGGLLNKKVQASNMLAIDPLQLARDNLIKSFEINVASDISQGEDFFSKNCLIILAVKPQQLREALAQLRQTLESPKTLQCTHLFLSIVAGVQLADITIHLNQSQLVRAMPNTPALIGKGVTGLYASPEISQNDQALITWVCDSIGQSIWVSQEHLLDSVTALSGSGPAYVFSFIEHLQLAGQKLGLSPDQANQLAIQTVIGAGLLANASPETPATLREKVTSKGGTTFAALEVLKEKHWGEILQEAVHTAHARSVAMGQEFSEK